MAASTFDDDLALLIGKVVLHAAAAEHAAGILLNALNGSEPHKDWSASGTVLTRSLLKKVPEDQKSLRANVENLERLMDARNSVVHGQWGSNGSLHGSVKRRRPLEDGEHMYDVVRWTTDALATLAASFQKIESELIEAKYLATRVG